MDFISNPNLPNILLKAERRDNLIRSDKAFTPHPTAVA